MKLPSLLLLCLLSLPGISLLAQAQFSVGPTAALDYVLTPDIPAYQSKGYGNQLSFRYGLSMDMAFANRFRVGIGIERYSRNEDHDCVYFPEPDELAQPAWHPLFDDQVYGCEYRLDSRINFLEIPLTASIDLWKTDHFTSYFGVGYGFQFITRRTTSMTDLQSGAVQVEVENDTFLASKQSIRFSVGGERKLSQRLKLGISLMYRADSFHFDYQSFGLSTGLYRN